jgi:UDP-GlcNAc:undecaprenyl-phosphate GlcNAc-1-phosphate transferase
MYLAKRFNAIDYPDGRRVNTSPTPRLGGIAIFFGIFLAIAILYLIDATTNAFTIRGIARSINYYGVAGAAVVIFAVGILDDFLKISALTKLLGQVVAAAIATASGVLISHIVSPFGMGMVNLGIFAYPVTVFYLVAFANIINLIDGLDGLAAGIVSIAAAALFILALGKGGADASIVAIAIVGACLGFLYFNFHPAKVFMGDSGSLLLGFSLGVISLFSVVRTPALVSLLIPVVIAGVPVIDTFTSIVRRLRAGKSIVGADKQHIHHRFINFGFDQATTVLIMYALSALLAVCAVLMAQYQGFIRVAIVVLLLIVVVLVVWRLGLMRSVLTHHYNKREKHEDGNGTGDDAEHGGGGGSEGGTGSGAEGGAEDSPPHSPGG